MALETRVYQMLVEEDEEHGCGSLPESVCREAPGNGLRIVGALVLQKAGDRIVDPKTVLPWLLAAVGAPAALTGLLVPVRESGSLLPQTALVPWVRARAVRKWLWVLGGAGQATAVLAMALAALTLEGTAAGVAVLGALAAFALARAVSSIAYKDVLGRTVPKGQRGQITGLATVGAGIITITVGLGIGLFGGADLPPRTFALLLAAGAGAWIVAALLFSRVVEARGEHDASASAGALRQAVARLRDDAPFRRFVVARTLLLVSALSPPFIVQLATEESGTSAAGLGAFIVASGVASLLGGRVWGRAADRSSKRAMMIAAGSASAVVVVLLAALASPALAGQPLLYPAAYLALALAHTGARVGRKTYLVDLAEGNERTDYVAVSNSAMGVLLLITGGITAAIAALGVEAALAVLALLGVLGVGVARSLPEVSASSPGA